MMLSFLLEQVNLASWYWEGMVTRYVVLGPYHFTVFVMKVVGRYTQ